MMFSPAALPYPGQRHGYLGLLRTLVHRRIIFVPVFILVCISAAALIPWLGRDFFPSTDSGQFMLHFRAKTGTRIENTPCWLTISKTRLTSNVG